MSDRGTACDTSLLVPALLAWHPAHEESRRAFTEQVTHLPAHVVLECYSVLTRLPSPHRVAPNDAARAIAALDPRPVTLPATQHSRLVTTLAAAGIRGGAVYDALVASTAAHHGLSLLTRDRRAIPAYDLVGVRYSML